MKIEFVAILDCDVPSWRIYPNLEMTSLLFVIYLCVTVALAVFTKTVLKSGESSPDIVEANSSIILRG